MDSRTVASSTSVNQVTYLPVNYNENQQSVRATTKEDFENERKIKGEIPVFNPQGWFSRIMFGNRAFRVGSTNFVVNRQGYLTKELATMHLEVPDVSKAKSVSTVVKTSGWIKKTIFNLLDPAIQKKVASAIEKGIVAPTGKQGIIKLTATEAAETGYQYKIKILGKGGDTRIYGNPMENGHILFDYKKGH